LALAACLLYRKARINIREQMQEETVNKVLRYFQSLAGFLNDRLYFFSPGFQKHKLKILIIMPYAPYPVYTGGASRIFQKIKYFGSRHHVVVASFCGSRKAREELGKILKPWCRKLILVKREESCPEFNAELPYLVRRVTTKKMWKELGKLSGKFDIVMFERIHTAMYRELFESCFTIMEEHNIESRILQQYAENNIHQLREDIPENEYDINQVEMLRAFEKQHWPLFDLRTTVSETDRDAMRMYCDKEILVVNNGVDANNIQPVEYNNNGKILYMGNMSYRPNIEAVKYFMSTIHPVLISKDPELSFCIAGVNISTQIREQAESLDIDCIESPEDMSEVAAKCSVAIVPLQIGSGTRIKILHAMAMGLPVVSTSLGCEGLTVTDEEHLLIRDDPESFADAVLQILSDELLRNRLRLNGRRLVKLEYNWQKIFRQYEVELMNRASKKHVSF
jgi:glycosyltransferase involved in cell wall biosynthesis